MTDKNIRLALIAGFMLVMAVVVLSIGLSYRAGYTAGIADQPAVVPTQIIAAGGIQAPTYTPLPTDESAEDSEPQTAPTDEPTSLPPTAVPQSNSGSSSSGSSNPPASTATPTNTPGPTQEPLGEVRASIAKPSYLIGGRWAEVMLTVSNISVESGVATGYTYHTPNPGGFPQIVTIFSVIHDQVPLADVDPDAPMWIGWVEFTDGKKFYFPAGCFYVETVDAEGWEPIGDDPEGYFWTSHWEGGFYDCGNSTHKIPQQSLFMPGESVTIPLYVYLTHPRVWEDERFGAPKRQIAYIGLEIRDGLGRSLGIVAEYFFP